MSSPPRVKGSSKKRELREGEEEKKSLSAFRLAVRSPGSPSHLLLTVALSAQMTTSSSSADDYARACLRVACAQLAEAAGFASARRTALDVLSDAAARYAASLGRAAKGYAEAAGRGTGNISDVVSKGNGGRW